MRIQADTLDCDWVCASGYIADTSGYIVDTNRYKCFKSNIYECIRFNK